MVTAARCTKVAKLEKTWIMLSKWSSWKNTQIQILKCLKIKLRSWKVSTTPMFYAAMMFSTPAIAATLSQNTAPKAICSPISPSGENLQNNLLFKWLIQLWKAASICLKMESCIEIWSQLISSNAKADGKLLTLGLLCVVKDKWEQNIMLALHYICLLKPLYRIGTHPKATSLPWELFFTNFWSVEHPGNPEQKAI